MRIISTRAIPALLFFCFSLSPLLGQEIGEAWNFPEARQFDFWVGEWQVQNRFKQEDNSWKEQGGATVKIFPVLDGKAVMEFWSGTARDMKETKGFSLRYFDPETRKWQLALNWPQPNNGGFFFLEGEFRHNRGEFFSEYENQQGEQVMNRYTFADISDSTLRWNDGTSLDGGKTWETKWIMEFSRTGDKSDWPAIDQKFHTYENDSWNTTPAGARFNDVIGSWQGELELSETGDGTSRRIEMNVWKVLNGIAYLMQLQTVAGDPYSQIMMLTYRQQNNIWLLLELDNRKETDFNVYGWKVGDGSPVFKKFSRDKSADVTLEWNESSRNKFELIKTDKSNDTKVRTVFEK